MAIYDNYLNGAYYGEGPYWVEAVAGSEYGVEFFVLSSDIRSQYEAKLAYRISTPMVDEAWHIGSFADVEDALGEAAEMWQQYNE